MSFTTTQAGASADYAKYLYGDLVKSDRVGEPVLLDFALAPVDGSFVKLNRGAYITVSNSTYGTWFTGYITNDPEIDYLGKKAGQGVWGFKYEATSDDYLLNLKPIGIVPPFINTTQGAILKTLINKLAPGVFTTTGIQNGLTVTRYVVDPNKHFSDVLKEFTDAANYRWAAESKALTFEPQSNTPATIAVDGNSKHFTPSALQIKASTDQVINDIIVLGDLEPQNYINEYYVGDGLTASFPLISSIFGVDRSVLLDEDFSGSQIDANKWTLVDTINNYLQTSGGFLNALGGDANTSYGSYIQSAHLIPVEGTLRITHGEYDFVDNASPGVNGVIGGLWTAAPSGSTTSNASFPGCLYGFRIYKTTGTRIQTTGGTSTIKYFWNGPLSVAGSTYVVTLTVLNQGLTTVTISNQLGGSTTIAPGQSKNVSLTSTGDGTHNVQIVFSTAAVGDSLDVIGINPVVTKDGGSNLVTATTFTGTGWAGNSGSTPTITQNTTGTALATIANSAVNTVNSFTIDFTKRYIMRTVISVNDLNRQQPSWGFIDGNGVVGAFGGGLGSTSVTFSTFISEIDPTTAAVTRTFTFNDSFSIPSSSSGSALYTPLASNDLHCTVTGITVSVPMQATLEQKFAGTTFVANAQYAVGNYVRPTVANGFIYKVTVAGTATTEPTWPITLNQTVTSGGVTFIALADAYQKQIIGPNELDSFDGQAPVATITDANNGVQTKSTLLGSSQYNPGQAALGFFKDTANQKTTVPSKGDLLHLSYRRPGASMARVQNLTSIATEAAAWGDDGVRSLTKRDISPLPKTAAEAELAAAALLQDFGVQHYEGTYTMPSGSWFTGEPISGTVLKFQNLPAASFPSALKAEVITEVKTTWQHQFGSSEQFQHEISFGKVDHLRQFLADLSKIDDIFAPTDTAELPQYIDVNDIGNTYVADVVAPSLVSVDANNFNFNTNQAPPVQSPNLLIWTEDFTQTTWQKVGVPTLPTITANAGTDPLGGTSADRIQFPTGTSAGAHVQQNVVSSLVAGKTVTLSGWIKSNTAGNFTGLQLLVRQVSDNAVYLQSPNLTVTPTWQRFSVTGTIPGTAGDVGAWLYNISNAVLQDVLVWGFQLEVGSAPTAYVSATSTRPYISGFEVRYTDESWGADDAKNLVTRTSGSTQTFSVPRNTRGKICFVKGYDQRNKVVFSEDITNAAWVRGSAVTSVTNAPAVNPDGNTQLITTVATSAVANRYVTQTVPVPAALTTGEFSVSLLGTAGNTFSVQIRDSSGSVIGQTTGTFTGKWQRVTCSGTGTASSTGNMSVWVLMTTSVTQTFQITRASFEANVTSETLYCKTNSSARGAMSRFAAGLHVAYPLVPPAPSGTVDSTNVTAPVISVTLPTVLTDVWGVEVRASDNTTVLYRSDLTDASYNPKVTVSGNNTRSLSYFLYTYNLLGEYSPSFNLTATIPTPSVSGVSVVDANKSLIWTFGASTSSVKVEIDDTSSAFGHIILTDANNPGTVEALSDQDFFKQRWFRVTPFDGIGSGTPVVVSHVYTPAVVVEFTANEVASIPAPTNPTTDPSVPTALSDFPQAVIDRSWANRKINQGKY